MGLLKRFVKKHRVVSAIFGAALFMSVGAAAAFLIYSGVTGTPGGSFSNVTSNTGAIVVTNNGTAPATLSPNSTVDVPLNVTNADPNNSHTITSGVTVAFSSNPAACASHLSLSSLTAGVVSNGTVYTAGQVRTADLVIAADSTLPSTCEAGTYTATFTGTTS